MNQIDRTRLSRRTLTALAGAAIVAPADFPGDVLARQSDVTPVLPVTPSCADEPEPTAAQTAGPFFTPNAPERRDLRESGLVGEPLALAGFVLDQTCAPAPGALLEFWQANAAGVYDNEGDTLCGHQFTDDEGRWQLETILPGLYPGRTRHIHVRVQPAGGSLLTTQLYFPDEPGNDGDFLFDPALVVEWTDPAAREPLLARFDFVLDAAGG